MNTYNGIEVLTPLEVQELLGITANNLTYLLLKREMEKIPINGTKRSFFISKESYQKYSEKINK